MTESTIPMPRHLTADLLRVIRDHDLTRLDDPDKMDARIGWLICAYDILVEHARQRHHGRL